MESLGKILDKCTDRDKQIIEEYELYVYEALDEFIKGAEEGLMLGLTGKTECTSRDEVCEELEFLLPSDDFKKVAFVLYLFGLTPKCAKSLAYAYFADMLVHAEEAEEDAGEEEEQDG